ncbi:MAG: inorganic phosphate transporter [Proteobacteria bacterium]|nr:inorganic phosphate transporter [Pseudomonadota bacterium]
MISSNPRDAAGKEAGLRLLAGVAMLVGAAAYVATEVSGHPQALVVGVAGLVGMYVAMNIGANDVANNVGAAVGSRALTMTGALAIAVVFEAAGAVFAGGDVVATISKGIIDPHRVATADHFVWLMLAALLAAGVWINLATYVGAPVSTTHAIVGGVLGAGTAAAGIDVVDWPVMGKIAASWVISPLMGAAIAAALLAFIKAAIIFREDRIAAARKWVPALVAVIGAAFAAYLMMKGLKRVWKPDPATTLAVSGAAFATIFVIVRPMVAAAAETMENTREDVGRLFTIPLIGGAALLCFAHGSNDVANAIGPLAAIVSAAGEGGVAATVVLPPWVIVIGALGLSAGLALFGGKLVQTVGTEITEIDRVRAFAVVLSAAVTVIIASALALPVSSTHITLGAIFGIGFLREYLENQAEKVRIIREFFDDETEPSLFDTARGEIEWRHSVLQRALKDLLPERDRIRYFELTQQAEAAVTNWQRKKLVRRSLLRTIVMAWLITVPATAAIAGLLYLGATAIVGPPGQG